MLLNLLNVLSENGRLASAPKVFEDFSSLMGAYRGELEVIVTSAEPLDNSAMQRLDRALKATDIAKGKKIKIQNKVRRIPSHLECDRSRCHPGFGRGSRLTRLRRSTRLFLEDC